MRTVFDIGNTVICDLCNKNYTDSLVEGGLQFGRKAVCPECAPQLEADAKRYGEERFIGDRARPGETFAQACLRWRDGNNTITITVFE